MGGIGARPVFVVVGGLLGGAAGVNTVYRTWRRRHSGVGFLVGGARPAVGVHLVGFRAMLMAVGMGSSLLPERRPATLPGDDRNRAERKYLRFAAVGVQYTLTILLLTLFGIWLDGRLGTGWLFTLVLLLLGFVGATLSLIHQVLGPDDPSKKK